MISKKDLLFASKFEDEVLDLIDNRDQFTRSDLQRLVSVLVQKIITEARKQEQNPISHK
jgi:hypothetical protein